MTERILILGGTAEARTLANNLLDRGKFHVITSLAGRTDNPRLPGGEIRIGGFGGIEGLADYLKGEAVSLVIDATHPFAARISTHATEAAKAAGANIIRLERPAWKAEAGDRWHHVPSVEEAVHLIPDGASTLVTIGRQQLGAFLDRDDIKVVARAIEGPKITVPESWTVILARPPFPLAEEIALFEKYEIDVLVTKNAGGTETRDKLLAARALEKPVIMIDRLPKPDVETYATMEALLSRLDTL